MIGDVYQGRGEVYGAQGEVLKNLFGATQGINSVVAQIHSLKTHTNLADRYQANASIGMDTLQSYERLSVFYQQRVVNIEFSKVILC